MTPQTPHPRTKFGLVVGLASVVGLAIGAVGGYGLAPTLEQAREGGRSPGDRLSVEHDPVDHFTISYDAPGTNALIHYVVLDPRTTTRDVVYEWNATDGEEVVLALRDTPNLAVIAATPATRPDQSAIRWTWHGNAHVLITRTIEELATQLESESE